MDASQGWRHGLESAAASSHLPFCSFFSLSIPTQGSEIVLHMPLTADDWPAAVSEGVMHDQESRLLLPATGARDRESAAFHVPVFDVSQKVPLTEVRAVAVFPAASENAAQSRLFDTQHSLLTLGTRGADLFGTVEAQHVLTRNLPSIEGQERGENADERMSDRHGKKAAGSPVVHTQGSAPDTSRTGEYADLGTSHPSGSPYGAS